MVTKVCLESKCNKLDPTHGCSVYNRGGMRFRGRQGYCPIPDFPKPVIKRIQSKNRAGQQKQKKS